MWLRVRPGVKLEVLDYTGAPYLRFSRSGVEVNENAVAYYLNRTPVEVPPPGLNARTPPRWLRVSGGHEYGWHDGRLSALASTALAPGASYVGKWNISVRLAGHLASISGGLWYEPNPPVLWFWPAIVIFACVLAAYRLRRPQLDLDLSRILALAVLAAVATGTLGRQLQGRPSITAWQIGLLVPMLLLIAAALTWTLRGRPGCFFLFIVCVASVWEDFELIPTLVHGYVLMALPASLIRIAAVTCLGAGAALFLPVVRMAGIARRHAADAAPPPLRSACMSAWALAAAALALLLAGCGSTHEGEPIAQQIPSSLLQQARPIGQGVRFHPPVRGPVIGACRQGLGRRHGTHVEVFARNRVMLLAAGIGTKPPRSAFGGRITHARCYGALVTLDPTGLVLMRPGKRLHLSDLFRSWGQALSARRIASFAAPAGNQVSVFVNGRRWNGAPGGVPLERHWEIVIEAGPHVPPHRAYRFPPGT